jgi:hypothetical protein
MNVLAVSIRSRQTGDSTVHALMRKALKSRGRILQVFLGGANVREASFFEKPGSHRQNCRFRKSATT